MAKLFYKPLGVILGVLAGRIAGKLFKQLWELAARESASPSAMDRDRGWGEIIAAAAIRGAATAESERSSIGPARPASNR